MHQNDICLCSVSSDFVFVFHLNAKERFCALTIGLIDQFATIQRDSKKEKAQIFWQSLAGRWSQVKRSFSLCGSNQSSCQSARTLLSLLVNGRCRGLSSFTIVGSSRFGCPTGTSEAGRAQQVQNQSQHHPSHHDHRQGQISIPTNGPTGTWHFLKAFCVRAVGLGIPEQVDKAPHSILMVTDALTGVEASFCHFSPDNIHFSALQMKR